MNGEDCIPYGDLAAEVEFSTRLRKPRPARVTHA